MNNFTSNLLVLAVIWTLQLDLVVSAFSPSRSSRFTSVPRLDSFSSSSSTLLQGVESEDTCDATCNGGEENITSMSRRSILKITTAAATAAFTLPLPSFAEGTKGKVVVFGGSGYVGSYVSESLAKNGYSIVSVSRSSPDEQASKVSKILGRPSSKEVEYVSLDAATSDLSKVLAGAKVVVSCVGVAPGGSNQRAGNGAVNVSIANAAKTAGVERFVYVSVASELANGPAKFLLGDYLKGKAEAEAAVLKDFPQNSLVVKPAIIAGGPPGEIRPPGPPGVKPASVEEVAKAVVAGAVGEKAGTIDGNGAIAAI